MSELNETETNVVVPIESTEQITVKDTFEQQNMSSGDELTPYSDKFNSLEIKLSEDKTIKVSELWISNCSLKDVALAILSKIEMLKQSTNIRDKELYNGYMSVKVEFMTKKKTTVYNISIFTLAKEIMGLCNVYSEHDFVDATIGTNWRWTIDRAVKEERGFDPFGFAKNELDVKLKDAKMTLLVKALRMYLIESVRRLFPKQMSPSDWKSSEAVYKFGGIERSSSHFVQFVESLFRLYDQVVKLSSDLTEIKLVVNRAITLGKAELAQKKEHYQKQRNLEANYNQSIGIIDVSSGVGKRKDVKKVETKEEPKKESKKVDLSTNQWKGDKWSTENNVVKHEKMEEMETKEDKKDVSNNENQMKTENTGSKKRTVKSGAPKKGKDQKQEQKQVQPSKEELEKQGWKTAGSKKSKQEKKKKPNKTN